MTTILESFKSDLFEKSLFIQNNQFVILYSSDIAYEDYGYEYLTKSLIYAQLENNIYLFKIFRLDDEKMIAEITLDLKDNLVNLSNVNIFTSIKSKANNRIYSTSNLKLLIVFFLSFIQSNSKELVFGGLDSYHKEKYKDTFKYLNL